MPLTSDVVVIGAGFAGAATAYHLVRLGVRSVTIVEREPWPGAHASGRNAGIARQTALPPAITPLAVEGARLIREPPPDLQVASPLRPCGSIVVAEGEEAVRLRAVAESEERAGLARLWLEARDVVRLVPVAEGGAFAGGVFGPDDGVVDIAALLQAYLRAAVRGGARLLTERTVVGIRTVKRRVTAVETDGGAIVTEAVVNAAGAWAGLRTLTPDGSFVIGRDPEVGGFVWCAGLGGHGVTASGAVGRVAAEAVLGRPGLHAHAPDRFVSTEELASDGRRPARTAHLRTRRNETIGDDEGPEIRGGQTGPRGLD